MSVSGKAHSAIKSSGIAWILASHHLYDQQHVKGQARPVTIASVRGCVSSRSFLTPYYQITLHIFDDSLVIHFHHFGKALGEGIS